MCCTLLRPLGVCLANPCGYQQSILCVSPVTFVLEDGFSAWYNQISFPVGSHHRMLDVEQRQPGHETSTQGRGGTTPKSQSLLGMRAARAQESNCPPVMAAPTSLRKVTASPSSTSSAPAHFHSVPAVYQRVLPKSSLTSRSVLRNKGIRHILERVQEAQRGGVTRQRKLFKNVNRTKSLPA